VKGGSVKSKSPEQKARDKEYRQAWYKRHKAERQALRKAAREAEQKAKAEERAAELARFQVEVVRNMRDLAAQMAARAEAAIPQPPGGQTEGPNKPSA
jgi:hypothetical protein